MLFFPLKKEWFDKIKSGEKTIEYREVKPYWIRRVSNIFPYPYQLKVRELFLLSKDEIWFLLSKDEIWSGTEFKDNYYPCQFRKGYTGSRLFAQIKKIEIVNGINSDLHIDKPVFAFHFSNVTEKWQ